MDNIRDAEIKPSPIHGNGLYATRDVAAGEILGWLDGQILDWASYDLMREAGEYGRSNADLFMEWNALSTDTLLVRPFRTKYSFINHSREPNVKLKHDPLRLAAALAIAADEELTLDYRREPLREDYLQKATFL